MTSWILLLAFQVHSGKSAYSIEFNDVRNCNQAAAIYSKQYNNTLSVCVRK